MTIKRHFQQKWLIVTMLATFIAAFVVQPSNSLDARSALIINPQFDKLQQGTAGIIGLSGGDIANASASVFGSRCTFFGADGSYTCLLPIPMEQPIKTYPLNVTINLTDSTPLNWTGTLKVITGNFIAEPMFTIPSAKLYLLRPDIEANEAALLQSIYSRVTPECFWEGTFTKPVVGKPSSPFGTVRTYNDGSASRHTGYDLVVPTGTPVHASANGRVVFALPVDIHGQIVIIDHGEGIFSSYSHLSEIDVVPGEFVLQGDVIARSGNTGRSLGPHVHWEIAINGIVVDPISFMQLKLPNCFDSLWPIVR